MLYSSRKYTEVLQPKKRFQTKPLHTDVEDAVYILAEHNVLECESSGHHRELLKRVRGVGDINYTELLARAFKSGFRSGKVVLLAAAT